MLILFDTIKMINNCNCNLIVIYLLNKQYVERDL